jgi:hypothetical protein
VFRSKRSERVSASRQTPQASSTSYLKWGRAVLTLTAQSGHPCCRRPPEPVEEPNVQGRRWRACLAIEATPAEHLVRVDVVLPRNHRNRSTRSQGRRHDLPLQRLRPTPMPPLPALCVHIRHRGHIPECFDPKHSADSIIAPATTRRSSPEGHEKLPSACSSLIRTLYDWLTAPSRGRPKNPPDAAPYVLSLSASKNVPSKAIA